MSRARGVPGLAFPRPGPHSGCWARLSSLQGGPVRPCWVRGTVAWVPPCTGGRAGAWCLSTRPSPGPRVPAVPVPPRLPLGVRPRWHSSWNMCQDVCLRQGGACSPGLAAPPQSPGNQEGPELSPRGSWLGLGCVQGKGDPSGQVVVVPVPTGWSLSHPWVPAPAELPLWSPWVMQMKPDPEFPEVEPYHIPTLLMSVLEIQPQTRVQVWTVKVGWRPRASHQETRQDLSLGQPPRIGGHPDQAPDAGGEGPQL